MPYLALKTRYMGHFIAKMSDILHLHFKKHLLAFMKNYSYNFLVIAKTIVNAGLL